MQGSTATVATAALRDRSVLLLDLSKSMLAPLPDPEGSRGARQKIEVARTAVYRILKEAAKSGTPFGLVTFTDTVRVPVPLGAIREDHLPYIENLISLLTPNGRSAIWDAIAVGADLLRGSDLGVRGNLVLVTDGWDNASTRFGVRFPADASLKEGLTDLVPYVIATKSEVNLRVVGIGDGAERDKGVDAGRIGAFLEQLGARARSLHAPGAFSFQEVTTGSQLFTQMVQAFLDVGYSEDPSFEGLHPEELALHAASAARALKEPQQHGTIARIRSAPATATVGEPSAAIGVPDLEVGVLSVSSGPPAYLKDRYGPLGEVVDAYLASQFDAALDLLKRASRFVPPVTLRYWEARIQFARGATTEAARALLDAWTESEKLPSSTQAQIGRRLALLQAKMQNDRETEALVRFLDDTENRLEGSAPGVRERLRDLFGRLMELRGTYQLTRLAGEGDLQDAAQKHEAAVEDVFGRLQDARLDLASSGPVAEGALDFIEICLAEMR